MRVMTHALIPAAVPTATVAVAMHCMHTVSRVCQPRLVRHGVAGSLQLLPRLSLGWAMRKRESLDGGC
jgi:hypothetical protein